MALLYALQSSITNYYQTFCNNVENINMYIIVKLYIKEKHTRKKKVSTYVVYIYLYWSSNPGQGNFFKCVFIKHVIK